MAPPPPPPTAPAYLHPWYIAGICFIGVQVVLSSIICIAAYFQLCCGQKRTAVDSIYKYLTLFCMSSFMICVIGDLVHVIIRYLSFPDYPSYQLLELRLLTANDSVHFLGHISFFILLLVRVHSVFKLRYCKLAIFWFMIFLVIAAAAAYCWIIYYFSSQKPADEGIREYVQHLKYAVVPLSVMTFVLDISFFTIFGIQMKRAAVDVYSNTKLYCKVSNVLTKHIVLFSSAIFTNQIYFAYLTYSSYKLVDMQDPYQRIPYLVAAYMIRSFEVTVNVFVLWAVISINHDAYLCICKLCHLCVARVSTKNNNLPLENPYRRMSTSINSF